MSRYRSEFASLWEQSKREHIKDVQDKVWAFRKRLRRLPSLLSFLLSIVPKWRMALKAEQTLAETQFNEILAEYVPKIRKNLVSLEKHFNEWESGNAGYGVGSHDALRGEDYCHSELNRLWPEMLAKLQSVPKYKKYFHLPENPSRMVENPYPGYLSVERAVNYCDCLLKQK